MNIFKNDKSVFMLLLLLYFVVNIPLLLNVNGVYWDGWTLINQSYSTIHGMFYKAAGYKAYVVSGIHWFMIDILGVYSYRIFTFLFLFLSGWFVYKILSSLPFLTLKDSLVLSLFFLLAPIFSSKIELINFPYTFFSFIFYLSFFVLAKNIANLTVLKRILVLMLFFFSFSVNSLLVFYAIILLYLFYSFYEKDQGFLENTFVFIKQWFDFILIPVVFYLVKLTWFKPSAFYENYNDVNLNNLLQINSYIQIFDFSFFQMIRDSILSIPYWVVFLLALILFAPLFNFFMNVRSKTEDYSDDIDIRFYQNSLLFGLGIIMFLLGAAPYMAAGKLPVFYGFQDRFQLLLSLGFAFILWFSIKIFVISRLRVYVVGFFIMAFSAFHVKEQVWYNVDYFYQMATMEQLKVNEDVLNNTTFLVDSQLGSKLKHRSSFSVYELNGMSKLVFGEDSRLFVNNAKQLVSYRNYCLAKTYNCSQWKESEPLLLVIGMQENSPFSQGKKTALKSFLKLKYLELTNFKSFKEEVKKLVSLRVYNG